MSQLRRKKYEDDEALARALQEEYSKEFRQRNSITTTTTYIPAPAAQQQARPIGASSEFSRNKSRKDPSAPAGATMNRTSSAKHSNIASSNHNNNTKKTRRSSSGDGAEGGQRNNNVINNKSSSIQHNPYMTTTTHQSWSQAQYKARLQQQAEQPAGSRTRQAPTRTQSASTPPRKSSSQNNNNISRNGAPRTPTSLMASDHGDAGAARRMQQSFVQQQEHYHQYEPTRAAQPAPPRRASEGTYATLPPPTVNAASPSHRFNTSYSNSPYLTEEEEKQEERDLRNVPSPRRMVYGDDDEAIELSDAEYARRLSQALNAGADGSTAAAAIPPPTNTFVQPNQHQPMSDEEFARRLQQEIEREEAARARGDVRGSSRVKKVNGHVVVAGTPVTSGSITSSDDGLNAAYLAEDQEVALRVEQELRDEELARRLSTQEQERVSARRAREYNANAAAANRNKCTFRRICSYLFPVIIVAAAAAGVVWYFTQGQDRMPAFWPTPEDFRAEDPFNSKAPSEVETWRTKGQGLQLEVISALDSGWIPFFNYAVSEWDNGDPDALTLAYSFTGPDESCEPINFKLKVCNGNYGPTRWRGINKILLTDQYIFASAARMNEYYFVENDDAQKHYTMCHEVGHGFGLPHSDESFTNKDRGDCMDYTNNPEVNMHPGTYNYEFLAQMYGTVPGYSAAPELQLTQETVPTTGGGKDGDRKLLRTRREVADGLPDEIPAWVMDRWRELETESLSHSHDTERNMVGGAWRLLGESDNIESHEIDIGDGYRIQVHKLLVPEDENGHSVR